MTTDSTRKMKKLPIRTGSFILLAVWSLVVGFSLALSIKQAYRSVLLQAESEANGHFNKDTVYRRWASQYGGVYVPLSVSTPASPYLAHVPERDITTPSGLKLTLVNPAYMTRQVQELSMEQYGVRGHLTSLDTLRPGNEPDDWERKALLAFNRGTKLVSSVETIEGAPYLRFMRPFITEESCLGCHGHQGYKTGDVRGGISVSVPLAGYYAQRSEQVVWFAVGHLFLYLFGSAGIWFGARLLRMREQENRLAWESLTLDEDRFRSLLALSRKQGEEEIEVVAFALEEAVRLTGSQVGYFHFYDETLQSIKLSWWSKNVEAQCKVAGMEKEYALEKAGVWADCLRQRRPVIHNEYQNLPENKVCPTGDFPILRHIAVPVFDEEQIVAIIGVGNKKAPYREDDITQLSLYASSVWKIVKSKQAETAIQQRDQELQATFDQAAVGVAHVGLDGRWLRVNGKLCDIVGYAAEELMELTFQDITHPEDLDTDLGYVQKVLAGELQTYSMEKRYIRKDRSLVWINLTVSLVHDASGAPRYFISIIEDIDERKRGEEELRKLYAELEQRVAERTAALTEKAEDLSRSQQALQYLLEDVNEAKKELETKITEIERMNRVFVHRELRMVELKEKIRELEKKQDGSDPSDPEGKA
ncbi:MAG: DUF3365 domain-containing protein [Proteobacteria bacterium]|nr:DUF3365 domain-containing protein [Pseudomonadota bacterium]